MQGDGAQQAHLAEMESLVEDTPRGGEFIPLKIHRSGVLCLYIFI